jgi:hypothetical protein
MAMPPLARSSDSRTTLWLPEPIVGLLRYVPEAGEAVVVTDRLSSRARLSPSVVRPPNL